MGQETPGISSDVDNVNAVGGGWINTGYDLTYNAIGILLGIIASLLLEIPEAKSAKKKRRKRKT